MPPPARTSERRGPRAAGAGARWGTCGSTLTARSSGGHLLAVGNVGRRRGPLLPEAEPDDALHALRLAPRLLAVGQEPALHVVVEQADHGREEGDEDGVRGDVQLLQRLEPGLVADAEPARPLPERDHAAASVEVDDRLEQHAAELAVVGRAGAERQPRPGGPVDLDADREAAVQVVLAGHRALADAEVEAGLVL